MLATIFCLMASVLGYADAPTGYARTYANESSAESPKEIVVLGDPCSPTTIKQDIEYKDTPHKYVNPNQQILERDGFLAGKYSLSCEGEKDCRGHIFQNLNGDVNVTPESNGVSISLQGNIAHNQNAKSDGPSDYQLSRRFERTVFISRENIYRADQNQTRITCEPGRCVAILLSKRSAGAADEDLILIRTNRTGVETAELIVDSGTITVYADDELNVGRNKNKLRACPSLAEVTRRRQGRTRGAR